MVLEIRNEITMHHVFWVGGGVNYQMQIVTKLPNGKYPNIPTTND